MQSVVVFPAKVPWFFGCGIDINRARPEINYRRSSDADFRWNDAEFIFTWHGRNRGLQIEEIGVPKWNGVAAGIVVGVEGINAIMLCSDEHHIMCSLPGNLQVGYIKRLSVNSPIYVVKE